MQTVARARRLRREMTLPEVLLWMELRKRPSGLKFRHQHPAGQYVLDFYCASARLAIEVDGEAHNHGDRPERDIRRDAWLARENVRVLRIPAKVILDDVAAAIAHIVAQASPDQPLHHASHGPPPRSGEELKGQ
ncbi:endonuclease domain-containing protein [Sphingomonas sp. RT2P30]|uniref:endonuclease domain-containing protein n=1 Tax=Parasphingomonas halimpatiens TaxID=3096162 RepID=UPI002FC7F5B6